MVEKILSATKSFTLVAVSHPRFAIFHYFQADAFLALGCLFVYGWFFAPITVIRGFSLWFSERGQDRDRRIVGKKWLWFIAFFLVDTVLFWISGGLMVLFTGGVSF